jgi:hypothetical protein
MHFTIHYIISFHKERVKQIHAIEMTIEIEMMLGIPSPISRRGLGEVELKDGLQNGNFSSKQFIDYQHVDG